MAEGVDGSSFFNSTASHVQRNVGENKTRTHDCCHETSRAKRLQQGAAVQERKSVRNTKLTAEERRKEGEKEGIITF
jgi:hypothetical protein